MTLALNWRRFGAATPTIYTCGCRPQLGRPGPDRQSAGSHAMTLTIPGSAELKAPRQLLRIRPKIFEFDPDLGRTLGQIKPTISGKVPTNRHTRIPNDSGPISVSFDDDPKLLHCEIAQPSLGRSFGSKFGPIPHALMSCKADRKPSANQFDVPVEKRNPTNLSLEHHDLLVV